TPGRWSAALARTRLETAPEFDAIWTGLTLTEQKTIRAIDETGGALYRPRTLQRLDLAKPSAQTAVRNLIAKAHARCKEPERRDSNPRPPACQASVVHSTSPDSARQFGLDQPCQQDLTQLHPTRDGQGPLAPRSHRC